MVRVTISVSRTDPPLFIGTQVSTNSIQLKTV